MNDSNAGTRLPKWLWIGLPLAVGPMQVITKAIGEETYRSTMRGELGLVENLTVLSLFIAIVTAFLLFARRREVAGKWFGPFALMMAAGCFFFAGEEASWGQHWFGFEPPESIAERNDQGEFNLHNDPFLELFLDSTPRTALTLAALVGGIIVPLRRRRGERSRPRFDTQNVFDWIWPTIECLPAAAMVVLITLPKKIFKATTGETPYLIDISPGETKELCLGIFLMIYLLVMLRELRSAPKPSPELGS